MFTVIVNKYTERSIVNITIGNVTHNIEQFNSYYIKRIDQDGFRKQ